MTKKHTHTQIQTIKPTHLGKINQNMKNQELSNNKFDTKQKQKKQKNKKKTGSQQNQPILLTKITIFLRR